MNGFQFLSATLPYHVYTYTICSQVAEKTQPVVIPIADYDSDKLFHGNGKLLEDFWFNIIEKGRDQFGLRYCGELKLALKKAIKLDNNEQLSTE